MLTLNQIKLQLIEYFNQHAQINSCFYEDDFDFNAERNIQYPVCNIEFMDASVSNKLLNYNFKIVLADLSTTDDSDMEDEIHSSMLMVADDFLSFLQYADGWTFNKTTSIQKFTDDTADRASGITFRISLSVIRSQNECQTPLK